MQQWTTNDATVNIVFGEQAVLHLKYHSSWGQNSAKAELKSLY